MYYTYCRGSFADLWLQSVYDMASFVAQTLYVYALALLYMYYICWMLLSNRVVIYKLHGYITEKLQILVMIKI